MSEPELCFQCGVKEASPNTEDTLPLCKECFLLKSPSRGVVMENNTEEAKQKKS